MGGHVMAEELPPMPEGFEAQPATEAPAEEAPARETVAPEAAPKQELPPIPEGFQLHEEQAPVVATEEKAPTEAQAWEQSAEAHPILGRVTSALHGAGELVPGREKMSAALHAALDSGQGGFEERYKKQLERQRMAGKALQEAYPVTHFAGSVAPMLAGPVAGGMAAGEGALANLAGRALPNLGKGTKALAGTAGFGGLYGAAQGAAAGDTTEEKINNALSGALIGTALPVGMSGVGKAVKSVFGPAGKTLTQEAAERLGPEVSEKAPRFITSEAPTQGVAAAGLRAIPVVGEKIGESSEGLNKALGDKILSIANSSQAAPEIAGGKIRAGVNKWIGEDSANYISGLYDDITKTFDDQNFKLGFPSGARANHPLNATSKVFNDMAEFNLEKGAEPGEEINSAMNIVKSALDRKGGLTFKGLQGLRQDVGDLLNSQEIIADKVKQRQLKQLYGGLSEDLKKAALKEGGMEGYQAFRKAENEFKLANAKRGLLRKITGVGENVSDEVVLNNLVNTVAKDRGDLRRLSLVKETLKPNDWNQVVSNMVHKLGYQDDNLGKGFSPAKFLTAYSKMAPKARDIMFGAPGSGYRQNIDDIALMSKSAVKAGQGVNTSKTAHVNETLKMFDRLGTLGKVGLGLGAAGAAAEGAHQAKEGEWGSLATELGGGYLLASLLASPRGSFVVKEWMQKATPTAGQALLDEVARISGRVPQALASAARTQAISNMTENERENRASGGKVDKRDYPAKRLTRMERALKRAQNALANETKPIMSMPDDQVAQALEIAKDK